MRRLGLFKTIRLVGAWCVGLYLARLYVAMGWIKFDPNGFWTPSFQRWGYPAWLRLLVGGIEVAGGVLILVPWVASYAAVAVAVVMAGAWGTRFRGGRVVDVAWIRRYLLPFCWI